MSDPNQIDPANGNGQYKSPSLPYYSGNPSTFAEASYSINSSAIDYFVLAEDPQAAAVNRMKNEAAGAGHFSSLEVAANVQSFTSPSKGCGVVQYQPTSTSMEYIPQRMATFGGCDVEEEEDLTKSKAKTIPYVPKPLQRKGKTLQYVPSGGGMAGAGVDDTDTPFAPYVSESDVVKESKVVKAKKPSPVYVPKTPTKAVVSAGKQSTPTSTTVTTAEPSHPSKVSSPNLKEQPSLPTTRQATKRPSTTTTVETAEAVVPGVKSARIAHKPSYDASLAPRQAVPRRVRPTRASLRQQMAERYEKVAAEAAAAAAATTSSADDQINLTEVKSAQLNASAKVTSPPGVSHSTATSSSSTTNASSHDNLKLTLKIPKPQTSSAKLPLRVTTPTTPTTVLISSGSNSSSPKVGASNRISTEPSASKSISVAPNSHQIRSSPAASTSVHLLVAKGKPAETVVPARTVATASRFTVGKRDKSSARVAHVPKPITAKDAAVLGIINPSSTVLSSGGKPSSSSSSSSSSATTDAQNRAALSKLLMPLADASARVPLSVRRSTLLKIRAELIASTGRSADVLPVEELLAKSAEAQQLEKEIAGRAKSNRNIYVSLGASKVATIRREQKEAKAATTAGATMSTTTSASSSKKLTNKKYRNLLSTAPATPAAKISHDALLKFNAKNCSLVSRESARVADLSREELVHQLRKLMIPSEELEKYGFPRPVSAGDGDDSLGKAYLPNLDAKTKPVPYVEGMAMSCRRCRAIYRNPQKRSSVGSSDSTETPKPACVYHEGRVFKFRDRQGVDGKYICCKGDRESGGCASATAHVTDGLEFTDAHQGFTATVPGGSSGKVLPNVFALDCEMCYTDHCLALSRVTLLNFEGAVVYDALVKPAGVILDYNTKFSGIKEGDLEGVTTTLADVQAEIRALVAAESILIGHGLDSDFRALKLFHEKVVDTTHLYPHRQGLPFKRSLRMLASNFLNRIIQDSGK